MHERKRLMFEKADAFVALPGGIGTLEELVEQLTWVQLQRHDKPVLIADIAGFWGPLLALLEHMRDQGFIRRAIWRRAIWSATRSRRFCRRFRRPVAQKRAPHLALAPGVLIPRNQSSQLKSGPI